jgi:hypothetical protein
MTYQPRTQPWAKFFSMTTTYTIPASSYMPGDQLLLPRHPHYTLTATHASNVESRCSRTNKLITQPTSLPSSMIPRCCAPLPILPASVWTDIWKRVFDDVLENMIFKVNTIQHWKRETPPQLHGHNIVNVNFYGANYDGDIVLVLEPSSTETKRGWDVYGSGWGQVGWRSEDISGWDDPPWGVLSYTSYYWFILHDPRQVHLLTTLTIFPECPRTPRVPAAHPHRALAHLQCSQHTLIVPSHTCSAHSTPRVPAAHPHLHTHRACPQHTLIVPSHTCNAHGTPRVPAAHPHRAHPRTLAVPAAHLSIGAIET